MQKEGGDRVKRILNDPVWREIWEDFLEKVMARHWVLKDHGWPTLALVNDSSKKNFPF